MINQEITLNVSAPSSAHYNNIGGVNVRFLGLDIANSYVKMWGDFGSITYPNTTKNLTEKAKSILLRENEGQSNMTIQDHVFTYTDVNEEGVKEKFHYQVGLTESGLKTSFAKDSKRYFNPLFKAEFILAVAGVANNGDNFAICTGLPSDHYQQEDIENHIKNFKGNYTVDRDGVPINFNIQFIYIELQPRGTYLSTVFQVKENTVVDRSLEIKDAKYVAILDGGFGSSDLAYFVKDNAGRSVLRDRMSVPVAMSNVYALLVDNLVNDYPALSQIELIEIESELRKTGKLYAGGIEIPQDRLKYEVDKAFGQIAKEIALGLRNKFQTVQLNYLIFTGGAMLALRPYIRDLLNGDYKKVIAKNPQLANAEGYYIRLHILKSQNKITLLNGVSY